MVQEYQRAADKKQFRRKHEGTLILYEAAAKALKEQGFQKLPDLYALKAEYKLVGRAERPAAAAVRRSQTPDAGVWHHQAECGRHPTDNTGKGADAGTVNYIKKAPSLIEKTMKLGACTDRKSSMYRYPMLNR